MHVPGHLVIRPLRAIDLRPADWDAVAATNAPRGSLYLDDADQPEDHQNDDDHADDSYATAHLDLPFIEPGDPALKAPS